MTRSEQTLTHGLQYSLFFNVREVLTKKIPGNSILKLQCLLPK